MCIYENIMLKTLISFLGSEKNSNNQSKQTNSRAENFNNQNLMKETYYIGLIHAFMDVLCIMLYDSREDFQQAKRCQQTSRALKFYLKKHNAHLKILEDEDYLMNVV